jgi:uncharacterized protein (UPF0335 family)
MTAAASREASAAYVKDEAAAHRFAKDHLKAFVERVERLEEEKKALSDDIRDVYSEAKANGFDVKALRTVVRLRKQDVQERAEQEAILETYLAALGMLVDHAVRTAEIHVAHARAQACEFASDADIRTTLPAPAKGDARSDQPAAPMSRPATAGSTETSEPANGNDPGERAGQRGPVAQPGELDAGPIETGGASPARSADLLASADPDANKGASGDDRTPCPASIQSSREPEGSPVHRTEKIRGPAPSRSLQEGLATPDRSGTAAEPPHGELPAVGNVAKPESSPIGHCAAHPQTPREAPSSPSLQDSGDDDQPRPGTSLSGRETPLDLGGADQPEHDSPPSGGDQSRPDKSQTFSDTGGTAPSRDRIEMPDFLRIGDPANEWLRPTKTGAAPATGPP